MKTEEDIDFDELYRTVRRIVNSYDMIAADKEDIVQDVVIKITDDCVEQWREEGCWQNFVAVITRNMVNDHFRKEKKRNKAMSQYTSKRITEMNQENYYDKAIERYQNNIDSLSEQQKKIVDLTCDGLGSYDIAKELSTTPGTVRVQLHRARKKMKRRG